MDRGENRKSPERYLYAKLRRLNVSPGEARRLANWYPNAKRGRKRVIQQGLQPQISSGMAKEK